MSLYRLIVLPINVLCILILLPTEAEVIIPLTGPGMNVQALVFDSYSHFLIFADIDAKTIHRYDPFVSTDQILQLDQTPSFISLIQNEEYSFLVTLDRDVVVLDWDYDSSTDNDYTYFTCLLVTVEGTCHGNRWNTGALDGYGRFWGGLLTLLDPPECDCPPAMYRLDTTQSGLLTPDVAVQNFYSNGIVFSADYRVMYTIDYYNRQVYSFNFYLPRGLISSPKVVFSYNHNNLTGIPTSITRDNNGNLWIGSYGAGEVIQIDPTTCELLRTLTIPASLITSVAFGGSDDLDVLFVGTMPSNSTLEPLGGSVFRVSELGVRGVLAEEAVVSTFCKPFYF